MKIGYKISLCLMIMMMLWGCTKEEEVVEPKYNSREVMGFYLDAMRQQDGVTMSDYTLSGKGDNFTISQSDAERLGLQVASANTLMNKVFSYEYTIDTVNPLEVEKREEVVVTFQSYDVLKVLNDAISANQKNFEEIQKGEESAEVKAQMITDILLSAFDEASLDKSFTYSFEVILVDHEWKVQDDNINDFYASLIGSLEE